MTGMFYTFIWVSGLCSIWLIWEFGYKGWMLARFRAHLFDLRDRLFSIAEAEKINFDDDAYRSMELLINAVIRYAHRYSFLTYIFSVVEMERSKKEDKDYVNFGKQMTLKFSHLDPKVRSEFVEILTSIHKSLCLYMLGTSFLFKVLLLVYYLKKFTGAKAEVKEQVIVLEREAYREAHMAQRHSARLVPV